MSILFIAEIGINHNGGMSICKELIDVAADAGCDAVKFQKRDINQVIRRTFWIVRAKAHGVKCSALKKRGWSSVSNNMKRLPATVSRKARSGHAASMLTKSDFQNVYNLKGGFNAWKRSDLPIKK